MFALAGHFGRRGAGYSAVPMLSISGAEPLTCRQRQVLAQGRHRASWPRKMSPAMLAEVAGYSDEMIVYEFAREDYARGNLVATALFHYQHGGLKELVRQRQAVGSDSEAGV